MLIFEVVIEIDCVTILLVTSLLLLLINVCNTWEKGAFAIFAFFFDGRTKVVIIFTNNVFRYLNTPTMTYNGPILWHAPINIILQIYVVHFQFQLALERKKLLRKLILLFRGGRFFIPFMLLIRNCYYAEFPLVGYFFMRISFPDSFYIIIYI